MINERKISSFINIIVKINVFNFISRYLIGRYLINTHLIDTYLIGTYLINLSL